MRVSVCWLKILIDGRFCPFQLGWVIKKKKNAKSNLFRSNISFFIFGRPTNHLCRSQLINSRICTCTWSDYNTSFYLLLQTTNKWRMTKFDMKFRGVRYELRPADQPTDRQHDMRWSGAILWLNFVFVFVFGYVYLCTAFSQFVCA